MKIGNQKEISLRLENAALFFVLFSIPIPLAIRVNFFVVTFVHIPMTILLCLWFARLARTGELFLLQVTFWDLLLVTFATWMCFVTLLVFPDNIGYALSWASMLFLAFYARYNINKTFDYSFVVRSAIIIICFQVSISFLQFFTHSYIGAISRYVGNVTRAIPEDSGLIRVTGTFPKANSLAMWIVILSPCIYGRMLNKYYQRKYSSALLLLLLFLLCISVVIIGISRWNLVLILLVPFIFLFLEAVHRKTKLAVSTVLIVMIVIFLLGGAIGVMRRHDSGAFSLENGFVLERMSRIERIDEHATWRMQQYALSLLAIQRRPLVGAGFKNGDVIWQETNEILSASSFAVRPHNIFLLLAVEAGLPATALFSLALAIPLCRYIKRFYACASSQHIFAIAVLLYVMAASVYLHAIEFWVWPLFLFLLGSWQGSVFQENP